MIREATIDDSAAIVGMGCRFIAETPYAAHLATNPERMAALVAGLIEGENGVIFVAEQAGALVGMIGFLVHDHYVSGERFAGEVFWWVNPDERGSTGVRLLKAAERWAIERGAVKVQMIAPTPAVGAIYSALGYQPVETTYQRALA